MDSGEELNERERVRAELRVLGARLNGRVPCEEGVHEWGQLHACRRGFGFSSVAVDDDDHLKRLCRALLRDSLSSFQRSDSKTRARYAAFSFYIFLDTKKKGSPGLSRQRRFFVDLLRVIRVHARPVLVQRRTQRYRRKEGNLAVKFPAARYR